MTDFAVALPALEGRDPLGFLAALGTLRLVPGSRLSFDQGSGRAVIHSTFDSTEAIAATLCEVVDQIKEGAILPDCPPNFPPAGGNSGSDPLRSPQADYHSMVHSFKDSDDATAWVHALTTDLAVDEKERGAISHYMAPAGKQRIYTFFAKPLQLVREHPEYLHQALTGWRRHADYSGEYFDHRAIVNAAASPTGKAANQGVPGATWLACMALPLFRTTGANGRRQATGWHSHRRQRRDILIWPLWSDPLGPAGAQALIEHPLLRPDPDDQNTLRIPHPPALLEHLGIFTVAAATRQPLLDGNSAGVLAPVPITIGRIEVPPMTATII